MRTLSKVFLAVLLLTVTSISWAACPVGTKQTYRGCEPDSDTNVNTSYDGSSAIDYHLYRIPNLPGLLRYYLRGGWFSV
jgi:hypothetical protein